MIKFKTLIHKEIGAVIQYEDYLEYVAEDKRMEFNRGKYKCGYQPKNVLFNDDFEIIYDSEFTLKELYNLYGLSRNLAPKIAKIINYKESLFTRYGFEV